MGSRLLLLYNFQIICHLTISSDSITQVQCSKIDLPHLISLKIFNNLLIINDAVPEARRTGQLQLNNLLFSKTKKAISLMNSTSSELILPYQKSSYVIRCTTFHFSTRNPHKKFSNLLESREEDFLASNSFSLSSKT